MKKLIAPILAIITMALVIAAPGYSIDVYASESSEAEISQEENYMESVNDYDFIFDEITG